MNHNFRLQRPCRPIAPLVRPAKRPSLLLVAIFRQALLGAVIFVRKELAGHRKPDAVASGMREPVEFEIEVDRRGAPRGGTSFSIRFSPSDKPNRPAAFSASGFGSFICPSSAPTKRTGDNPPISSVMCFHVQPFSRLMSRIFSVRSARFMGSLSGSENGSVADARDDPAEASRTMAAEVATAGLSGQARP